MDNKKLQTVDELKNHLNEQIEFLMLSTDLYDKGHEIEAKRMAVTIRTLVHDTRNSNSLLRQLNMKGIKFISTCSDMFINEHSISQRGLIFTMLGSNSPRYYAMLDDSENCKELSFDKWWNEKVIIDGDMNSFTRRDIILSVANKDGGAHIDPELDGKYASLSRENSLGNFMKSGNEWVKYKNPELATIRQIAHEILKVLVKDYTKKPVIEGDGYLIGNMRIETTPVKEISKKKIGRNEKCPCGSGLKYKWCCGK